MQNGLLTPALCSLDIVCYGFLKEQLRNTPVSNETKYLQSSYPKLVEFVTYMDGVLQMDKDKLGPQNQIEVKKDVNIKQLLSD